MKKICFLYIDEPYNIYHSLSIAIELHRTYRIQVSILCTERNHSIIDETLRDNNTTDLKVKIIRPFWHFTFPHYIEIKLQFRHQLFLRYRRLLSSYDGIVCSLYNDLLLKQYLYKKNPPKLIFAGHGIANRAYSYDDKIKEFDYILLAGKKEKNIRASLNQLKENSYLLTGYVKYDMCRNLKTDKIFQNDKPTVLYNPHWLREYSSFYDHGLSILEQFAHNEDYNLICAPHSLLTTRNKSLIPKINKYKKYKNIHIDLRSQNCHDMTYLKISDIYLGDISSQALEFLLHKKRPCLFIDINNLIKDKYEYHTWALGDVISDSRNITNIIRDMLMDYPDQYQSIQSAILVDLFHQEEKTASAIAAEGIYNYLSKKRAS